MRQQKLDALIGQLSADSTLMSALLCALIGRDPPLLGVVEQLVEVAAPSASSSLHGLQLEAFQTRMREHRQVLDQLR